MIGFAFAIWRSIKTSWIHPHTLWGLMDLLIQLILLYLWIETWDGL